MSLLIGYPVQCSHLWNHTHTTTKQTQNVVFIYLCTQRHRCIYEIVITKKKRWSARQEGHSRVGGSDTEGPGTRKGKGGHDVIIFYFKISLKTQSELQS